MSSSQASPCRIRLAVAGDMSAVTYVCLKTGDSGDDGDDGSKDDGDSEDKDKGE